MFKKKKNSGGISDFQTPEEREYRIKRLCEKQLEKEELFESIVNFFKFMIFTPLSMFLRVVAWATKIAGTISVLGVFAGIYNGWKFYKSCSELVAVGDFSLLKSCIGLCVLPIVLFAVNHGAELLADKLEY